MVMEDTSKVQSALATTSQPAKTATLRIILSKDRWIKLVKSTLVAPESSRMKISFS